MNDIGVTVSVAFDDDIPAVIVNDEDIAAFLHRANTRIISPVAPIDESSTADDVSSIDEGEILMEESENLTDEESSVVEEESSETESDPAIEYGMEFFAAAQEPPAVGGYSSGKFSGGQSFYVPWDSSYLDQYTNYISIGIGVIVSIALLGSALYFGIRILSTFLDNFKNKRG